MNILKKITNSLTLKITTGFIYSIVLSEIILRVFAPVPIIPRYVTATSFGIRGNIPNKSYWHKTADFRINIRTNSKGIRADAEIPYKKPVGIRRIVVLGDSFGMGYENNLEDTFLARMGDNLKKAGYNVQVVNLSVSGHGNAEELIMLENEGFKYEPDLVLLCWHVTDIEDNVRSDLYALDNGILKRKSMTYLPGVKISDMLYRLPLFVPVSENSHLYNWSRDEAGRKGKKAILQLVTIIVKLKGSDAQQSRNKNISDYPDKLSIALINQIAGESRINNSQFVVLDIPVQKSRFEFYSAFPDPDKYPRNFVVVSPIDNLHKNVVKNELFIWEHSHYHFTPKASRLVGQTLSDYIIKNNLLK